MFQSGLARRRVLQVNQLPQVQAEFIMFQSGLTRRRVLQEIVATTLLQELTRFNLD